MDEGQVTGVEPIGVVSASTVEPTALAAEIETLVRATPGVRSVYRSGSLVSNAIGAGVAALGLRNDGESLVSVTVLDERVSVVAAIGLDFTADAADTLRVLHEAIDARLAAQALVRERITLTVVYVQSREAS